MSDRCPTCERPTALCMCDRIVPLEVRTRVLVLRHPQEIDVDLGTAPLLAASMPSCRVVTGLSWGGLSGATGDPDVRPREWGVLWTGSLPRDLRTDELKAPFVRLEPNGGTVHDAPPLVGIVALDGTWSQAKTLWWRNAWLLKLQRLILHPTEPSIYGKLRKEPRREAVSTLEAVASALTANGEDPAVAEQLRRLMRTMCQRARDAARASAEPG